MMHSHIRWFHSYQWPNKTIYFTWRGSPHGAAMLWSESESDVTFRPSMVTLLGICALQLTHPKCAHTQQWTHTHREHTPGAVGSHLCCGARGAVGGSVPCSRAPQSWYWGWRERCIFTPPTYNPCRTWDLNSQPLDYESDSLTIRSRLPHLWSHDQLNY